MCLGGQFATDAGTEELDTLKFWRVGFPLALFSVFELFVSICSHGYGEELRTSGPKLHIRIESTLI